MKGLAAIGRLIWELFTKTRPLMPKMFVGVFVAINFFLTIFQEDFKTAVTELVTTFLIAEMKIHNAVELAVNNDPSYTVWSFLAIINGLLIIWFFVKWVGKALIGVTGSQAFWMAYVVAGIIFGIIEFAASAAFSGELFSFIPLWDGVVFLLLNLQPVIVNIQWINSFKAIFNPDYLSSAVENPLNESLNGTQLIT